MGIIKNVAVIGLGRTARAAAAYLMDKGCNVIMWGRSKEKAEELKRKGILVTGFNAGHYRPLVTCDMGEALECAQIVLVMTLASGHQPIASQMKELVHFGQIVVIFNGNWGAYEFYNEMVESVRNKQITIAETGSMLFLADYENEACHIKSIKKEIGVAALPPSKAEEVCGRLKHLFPQFVAEENVISTSINSSNPVMHVPVAMFNITRMENGEDYSFYGDAATRQIIHVVEKVDKERCAVARAVGVTPKSCLDIINSFWPVQYNTLFDAIKNNSAYLSGKGPKTLQHRYLEEDLPFGIIPLAQLGRIYGVETPCINALIDAFELLLEVDSKNVSPNLGRDVLERLTEESIYEGEAL